MIVLTAGKMLLGVIALYQVRKVLDYRFVYVGVSLRHPGRLKVGITGWIILRWKQIGESMAGLQFPIFFLPMFMSERIERHCHDVLGDFHAPIKPTKKQKASGWTEWFWIMRLVWLLPHRWMELIDAACRWLWVGLIMWTMFFATHISVICGFIWIWCWGTGDDFQTALQIVSGEVATLIRMTIASLKQSLYV